MWANQATPPASAAEPPTRDDTAATPEMSCNPNHSGR